MDNAGREGIPLDGVTPQDHMARGSRWGASELVIETREGEETRGQPDPPTHDERGRQLVWPAVVLVALGIAAIAFAEPLTDIAARVMPAAGEVRSHSHGFPSFRVAFPPMLRGLGAALLAAGATWIVAVRLQTRPRSHPAGGPLAPRI